MNLKNKKFKVGDLVKLDGCPFDEQIPAQLLVYLCMKDKTHAITAVCIPEETGTSGQWIKTNLLNGWYDKAWFKLNAAKSKTVKKDKQPKGKPNAK